MSMFEVSLLIIRLAGSDSLLIAVLLSDSIKSILDSSQLVLQGFTWVLKAYEASTDFLPSAGKWQPSDHHIYMSILVFRLHLGLVEGL